MDLNCQATGCDHAAARLVPDARGREESLVQVVQAPIAVFAATTPTSSVTATPRPWRGP